MSGKTKKIDKEFLITDSSVNCYGFRLLTSGYQMKEYQRNPIGYYMHNREEGVIVRWEDLVVKGDGVYGKPVINLSNKRGQQCVDEIEGGFLNGASVGHIVALEWSEDPKDMLPGQTGPTITKWYNREASICDVPGNMNALALFDKDGTEIKLSDFNISKKQIINMKEIKLTAAQLTKLSLTDTATDADVTAKIENLVAEAAKVPQLTADLSTARNEKKIAEDALAAEKKKNIKAEVKNLLDKAVEEKKMTVEMRNILEIQFAEKPVELKAIVDVMKPYESMVPNQSGENASEINELSKLSGEQLFQQGKFERLKELSASLYKTKYKDYFGEEPKA